MLTTLNLIVADPDSTEVEYLNAIVAALRPPAPDQTDFTRDAIRVLTQLLLTHPQHAAALRHYLVQLYAVRKQTSLYTDTGILPNAGFFTELFQRISFRLLPPALDASYLRDTLDQVFYKDTDFVWIRAVPAAEWLQLADVIAAAQPLSALPSERPQKDSLTFTTVSQMLDAVQTISYRITALGLEPSLLRLYPGIEDYTSPFLMQNVEVHAYLASFRKRMDDLNETVFSAIGAEQSDARHLHVMLDQCDDIVSKIRKNALKKGSSVALTYILVRLDQSLIRMRRLLALIEQDPASDDFTRRHLSQIAQDGPLPADRKRQLVALELGQELIQAHNQKYAVRELFAENINLLARNVTENASKTGQHYIAENRRDFSAMFRSAAGAGFIIGFMALFKVLYSYLHAPPFVEAFLYSMNYSLGFMLIYVLHFTVATKQPAMTASHIARSLHTDKGKVDIPSLRELVVKVMRTQFIAIAGNLLLALPTAFVLALAYRFVFGHDMATPEKSVSLLHDLNPVTSLLIPHAAIAGICLFLSGLISGYYDNKAAYTRIAERVRRVQWLQHLLGSGRTDRLASYMEENLGGLMGNFYFGIMLGSASTVGFLLGLPLDIRHITFSTANLALALVGQHGLTPWPVIATSVCGIVLIGVVNLWVSFSMALFVALRARRIRFTHGITLLRAVVGHFMHKPGDFFFPPKDKLPVTEEPQAEPSVTAAPKNQEEKSAPH